jgi:hypothetical protein
VGSTRRAARVANALIPAGNRAIDDQEKALADEKKKRKEKQKKRKAREALRSAVKKPEFKGKGQKLNDPDPAAELQEEEEQEEEACMDGVGEEAHMDGVGESVANPVVGLKKILDKHVKDIGLKESKEILIRQKMKGKIGNKGESILLNGFFKPGTNLHRLIRQDMRSHRETYRKGILQRPHMHVLMMVVTSSVVCRWGKSDSGVARRYLIPDGQKMIVISYRSSFTWGPALLEMETMRIKQLISNLPQCRSW